jgi:hypothetical protein
MSPRLKRYAKRAGAIALLLVALDVTATIATVAFGAEILKR